MTHVRQSIRAAIQTALAGVVPGRVYKSRYYPDEVLPAIGVYTNSESVESHADALNDPKWYSRFAQVWVEIKVAAALNADDEVDALCASVESALAADQTLGGLSQDVEYQGAAHLSGGAGTERQVMVARLTYRVWYRTSAADPETPL
jgi:hypothetical protein